MTLIKSVVNSYQNWGDLCRPKDQGGLAFCDVLAFNQALLAKQEMVEVLILTTMLGGRCFEIIKHNSATWRTDLLTLAYDYDPHTVNRISSIPLSVTGIRDRLIWKFSIDGNYNVKLRMVTTGLEIHLSLLILHVIKKFGRLFGIFSSLTELLSSCNSMLDWFSDMVINQNIRDNDRVEKASVSNCIG
ncbi:reverse transcriptase [Senna tora]|uniref:Reverse transcriptase n=1 Tax=Senna tora TaxID=362788 RepID=A0A834TUJ3_9FABA|nr:reverse transcriptase [Senna tora]